MIFTLVRFLGKINIFYNMWFFLNKKKKNDLHDEPAGWVVITVPFWGFCRARAVNNTHLPHDFAQWYFSLRSDKQAADSQSAFPKNISK